MNGLITVRAERPPEISGISPSADWKFETVALSDEFRHFELRALQEAKPTISIFDYIGDDGAGGGVAATRVAAALRSIGARPLIVEINSPGGNYFEGIAIYNLLRRHSHEVTEQVLGVAASAASVIAMAGDTIQIAHNAEIMIHEARGLFFGTKSEMKDAVSTLVHLDDAMTATYAARSGRDKTEFDAMIAGRDVFLRGQEAIDAGLADELMDRDAEMPVYANADDLPSDKASLDKLLAKQGMTRSQRRDLYRAMGDDTPNAVATNPATPRAGTEPDRGDPSRLLAALSA